MFCLYSHTARKERKVRADVSKRCTCRANGKVGSKSAISRGTLVPVTDDKRNREKILPFLGTQYCFQEDK
jgi:hypothetical protein